MHQDEGNYAGKHPEGAVLNEAVVEILKKKVKNERISCKAAHEAASLARVSPAEIGRTLDILEVRINGCQLGLFGHKTDHGKAEFRLPENPEALRKAVADASNEEGISCDALWKAAAGAGCTKDSGCCSL